MRKKEVIEMRTLPKEMIRVLIPFAPLFSERVFQHVQLLLAGAILTSIGPRGPYIFGRPLCPTTLPTPPSASVRRISRVQALLLVRWTPEGSQEARRPHETGGR